MTITGNHAGAEGTTVPEVLWPPEVDLILSALEAGAGASRRRAPRAKYRVRAVLRLFADAPDSPPWTLFTRDASEKGLGFITSHRLPLGYGGSVELEAPSGEVVQVPCTLFRCREAANGWFEGALYFNRPQETFSNENMSER